MAGILLVALWTAPTPSLAAAGDLDPSFGRDGKVATNPTPGIDVAEDVAMLPDGRIVVAGSGGDRFALARYDPRGRLDATFGRGGIVLTDVGLGADAAAALAVQPNGRVAVVGRVFRRGDMRSVLARYRANGTLDTSFSKDGRIVGPVAAYGATDVAIQADGKIVVAHASGSAFVLTRYERDGSLDRPFGIDGSATADPGGGNAWGGELAIQADGGIVVAGESDHDGSTAIDVVRFGPDGTLDEAFGSAGFASVDLTVGWDSADAIALQTDGKIVVAGEAGFCCEYTGSFGLARFGVDGTLDASFGDGGIVITSIAGSAGGEPDDAALGLAIGSDGKIVAAGVAGRGWDSVSTVAVVRYTSDGALDETFGTNGKLRTRFPAIGVIDPSELFVGSWASAVAIQSNGRIVVVGGQNGQRKDGHLIGRFVLARYMAV